MAKKKIPLRMCVACREMKEKTELVRIVKTPTGEIVLDNGTRIGGRGAYICKSKACLCAAQKTNALARAFEMSVSKEIYVSLEESGVFE